MKKGKNIVISSIILVVALICAVFKIDLSSYLDEINASFDNNSIKTSESSVGNKTKVELIKCVDGDTATFNIDGKRTKIRFLAIDTPESVHPYKEVEEYGKDASEYTCNLLTNANTIQIAYEDNMTKKDKYGRNLAWIWVDDKLIQESLIEVGYAQVRYVYANYSYLDKLYQAQKKAKSKKIGIWYDYEEPTYSDKTYTVTFKVSNKEEKVTVKEGDLVELIDNPTKTGYVFEGWTYSNQLYDLSKGVTRNITLKASFVKN